MCLLALTYLWTCSLAGSKRQQGPSSPSAAGGPVEGRRDGKIELSLGDHAVRKSPKRRGFRCASTDGGYDRREVYVAARKRGTTTVIPPRRDAVVSGEPVLSDRDAHLERIKEVGRRCWRLEAGQHHQARAENTFYRYKKRFGGRLTARNEPSQRNEVLTGCNILNSMTELGMPNSIALRG